MDGTIFQRTVRLIGQWQQRRRSIAQLVAMPDYLLADIGVERHEILQVVNGLTAKQGIESSVRRGAKARVPVTGELALSGS